MNTYVFQQQNPEAVWAEPPRNVVLQMDFRQMFCQLPDESIDLVLTDPPYWTLDKWREMGTTARLGGHRDPTKRDESKWFETIKPADLEWLIHEVYRVLRPHSFAYIMSDWQTLQTIYNVSDDIAWAYMKPLVWDKVNMGMGYHYRATYEFVVLFQKGDAKLRDLGIGDVLHFKRVVGGFPTEKPLRLFQLLIENSTDAGALVLDPFCGSGTTAEACRIVGRDYLCSDWSEDAIAWANKRLAQATLGI